MNRNKAKSLAATGVSCCAASSIVWFFDAGETTIFRQIILSVLFFGGILTIIFSLAYFTEK